jgi:hypothetical protein
MCDGVFEVDFALRQHFVESELDIVAGGFKLNLDKTVRILSFNQLVEDSSTGDLLLGWERDL